VEVTLPNLIKPRRRLPKRLHLPDCNTLAFARKDTQETKECDCGKPLGLMPHTKTLVRRYSEKRGRVALVVISKSNLREGEEDLCASQLLFEADSDAWIRQQLKRDDRKARRADIWTST